MAVQIHFQGSFLTLINCFYDSGAAMNMFHKYGDALIFVEVCGCHKNSWKSTVMKV